jgi:hypothetical protein
MKVAKLVTLTIVGASILGAGVIEDSTKLDVKKVCDVKANGLEKVLAVAEKYNPVAIKNGVEFMRFHIPNSAYIAGAKEAIKAKSKEATLHYKKKGKEKTKKFPTDYATWRACVFALRAVQQIDEANKTYKSSIPK